MHADYFSGWDQAQLQKVLDECKNDGAAAMPDLWCEKYLSFRDLPKMKPADVKDPDGSDARIVKMLKKIQPKPALDPQKTVCAEAVTGVKAIPQGSCTAPLIAADPNTDWHCTLNCTNIGASSGNLGGRCSDLTTTQSAQSTTTAKATTTAKVDPPKRMCTGKRALHHNFFI